MSMFGGGMDRPSEDDIDRESDRWLELRHREAMDSSMFSDSDDIDRRTDDAYLQEEQP